MNQVETRRIDLDLASIVRVLVTCAMFVGTMSFVGTASTTLADWTQAKKEIPPVLLSDQHRAMCKIGVGDVMPDAELAQLGGGKTHLKEHFGEKATVVLVFKTEQRMSRTGLADMETDVVSEFGNQGVNVVAVAVEGSAVVVQKLVTDSKASFPVLLDPQGDFFATVGTEKLPRVYLLDKEGKILWFDIEYSQTTRRELRQALGWRLMKAALP